MNMHTDSWQLPSLPAILCNPPPLASADHLTRLYCEDESFRELWEEYIACRISLRHWQERPDGANEVLRLEYAQTLHELEAEIRQRIEYSWNVVQDVVAPLVIGRAPAIEYQLRANHGLRGSEVYLALLFPVIDIAWLERRPDHHSVAFIEECISYICARLGRFTGEACVLAQGQRQRFISRFLRATTRPADLDQLVCLALAYLAANDNPALVHVREKALWSACRQVAHSHADGTPNPQQLARISAWETLHDQRRAAKGIHHLDNALSPAHRILNPLAWIC